MKYCKNGKSKCNINEINKNKYLDFCSFTPSVEDLQNVVVLTTTAAVLLLFLLYWPLSWRRQFQSSTGMVDFTINNENYCITDHEYTESSDCKCKLEYRGKTK